MKPVSLLLAAGLSLAATAAVAQDSPRSLNDARSDVIKGTGGITLFDFGRKAPPEAPAAAPAAAAKPGTAPAAGGTAAAAPTSGWGTPLPGASTAPSAAAAPAQPAAPRREPIFGTIGGGGGGLGSILQPPSGEPLSSAKKHESPSSGIQLPTGR